MKAFYHGHSYTGNPLACAVANASLTLLELPETKAQIHNIVQKHMAFSDSIKSLEGIHHVRQRGTIWAGDIDVGDSGYFSSIRDLLYQQAIDMGVLLRPLGNTLYIMPPYCIHVDELNTIYSTIIHITERAATKLY
jgi:adenosylmethionine-8-amino-7-oxononanoate aminotransferase